MAKKRDNEKKASAPKKKNLLRIARDNVHMTRKQVEAQCHWMTESKLEKIESGKQRITPDDVYELARIYGDGDLCETYCHKVCKIGTEREACGGECKPVTQIVIEMLSALNAANRRKDQLVDIVADGRISESEIADFVAIQGELERISDVAHELQMWTERMIDGQLIPQIKSGK